jgi:hypothetical protein
MYIFREKVTPSTIGQEDGSNAESGEL